MIIIDGPALDEWFSQNGLSITEEALSFPLKEEKATARIPTADVSGLTAFDVSRFVWRNLAPKGIVIYVREKGPFTEKEEAMLFQILVESCGARHEVSQRDILLFEESDEHYFVAVLSLGILFRWDFWLIGSAPRIRAFHSHDDSLHVFDAPKSFLDAALQLGMAWSQEVEKPAT